MSLPLDRSKSPSANLTVLQRMDRNILEILSSSRHVAVYAFDSATNSWKRNEMEGALFVVKRSTAPRFRLIVLNRLSTTNFVQDISSDFQLDVMPPYVIFRTAAQVVHGIWFHLEHERDSMAALLKRISRSLRKVEHLEKQEAAGVAGNEGGQKLTSESQAIPLHGHTAAASQDSDNSKATPSQARTPVKRQSTSSLASTGTASETANVSSALEDQKPGAQILNLLRTGSAGPGSLGNAGQSPSVSKPAPQSPRRASSASASSPLPQAPGSSSTTELPSPSVREVSKDAFEPSAPPPLTSSGSTTSLTSPSPASKGLLLTPSSVYVAARPSPKPSAPSPHIVSAAKSSSFGPSPTKERINPAIPTDSDPSLPRRNSGGSIGGGLLPSAPSPSPSPKPYLLTPAMLGAGPKNLAMGNGYSSTPNSGISLASPSAALAHRSLVLSKNDLRLALINLLESDDGFLEVIHKSYLNAVSSRQKAF